MKSLPITTILLIMFTYLQSALGYSPIWTIDGYDVARLKEAGITVKTWKHDQIGEDPALKWLEITFDTTKVGADQDVLMTLHVIADDHQTISKHRAEHKKGDGDKMKLLFAIRNENIKNSYVQILVPKLLSKSTERPHGNPGFGGYSLQLSRILQLAAESSIKKD